MLMAISIQKYKVVPSLPVELSALRDLAYNLYWTWDHDLRNLFRRLDRDLWESSGHNPVRLLGRIDQALLEARAKDDGYLSHLQRTRAALQNYLSQKSWFQKNYPQQKNFRIAYFSMEYGLNEGLPLYSGGLGVLSADHLKSASDLGIPLIGVGLLYQKGYFHQYLSKDGWQQENYPENDFYNMPIKLECDAEGKPITITVEILQRTVHVRIWRAQVGRVPLYLLDTNVPENIQEDQDITDVLYGGEEEMRIKQEIVLGIGGIRALEILGLRPDICHMNEGHSAFMALERVRLLMQESNLSFPEAQEANRNSTIFTSHTPVPAGIDEFDLGLIDRYIGSYYSALQISAEQLYRLGGIGLPESNGKFNMAIFAISMSGACNGVSKLHGEVARKMWHYLWPELPENEVPIGHVTNGVHLPTWISEDMAELFHRYLGPRWSSIAAEDSVWDRIQQIPDEELWRTHERRRERLVAFTRKRLRTQLEKADARPEDIAKADEVLDPQALTIGFARRFASYKRAKLIFQDLERLKAILNNKERPVQFIFAGKAHPRDNIGKGIIRDIVNIIRNQEFRSRIVFIEDYDMEVAASMVRGVDIWLNTPIRPREASGTSGMKASLNGALNVSILDGWWDEAYTKSVGWAIGRGEEFENAEEQDLYEVESLYSLLEQEVVPLFYQRSSNKLPREWIAMMKSSIQVLSPFFNTNRMVRDYFERYYLPAELRWQKLSRNNMELAKELAAWKARVQNQWPKVHVTGVVSEEGDEVSVGGKMRISATIDSDGLKPEELRVEVYYGLLDSDDDIIDGQSVVMQQVEQLKKNISRFEAVIPCEKTGQHGFSVRVMPYHAELATPFDTGLISWYQE
ncbi:MAG TPA: alpha-glucan family phosphorylase [bacterium]|nr:alpha-glucan family phosphorylase [bacterium]HQI48346.1 alpha-glucan family phosphorylase [bacterium]HQJ63448.1 alpha-glucan family phosphorylase [bacterium]